jgi:hypothetical protein
MGITLSAFGELLGPLQGLVEWFVPRARRAEPLPCITRPAVSQSPAIWPRATRPAAATRPCERTRRPLRVVRVVEGMGASASAGRMFMSGRMADVCAELDRLAAIEAAAAG